MFEDFFIRSGLHTRIRLYGLKCVLGVMVQYFRPR